MSTPLKLVSVDPGTIQKVHWAWGADDGSSGYSDQCFGFAIEMKDGAFQVLKDWCDTTGWGCHDGAEVLPWPGSERPSKGDGNFYWEEPDPEPVDLNLWLTNGARKDDRFD